MSMEETGKTLDELLCDLVMNNIDNNYISKGNAHKVKQKFINRIEQYQINQADVIKPPIKKNIGKD